MATGFLMQIVDMRSLQNSEVRSSPRVHLEPIFFIVGSGRGINNICKLIIVQINPKPIDLF